MENAVLFNMEIKKYISQKESGLKLASHEALLRDS